MTSLCQLRRWRRRRVSADDDGEVFEAAEHGGLATGGWGRREAEVGEPFEQAGDAPDVEERASSAARPACANSPGRHWVGPHGRHRSSVCHAHPRTADLVTGRLDEQVAVVTSDASGIGEATVRQFVAEGAHVVIADLQEGPGGDLTDELGGAARFVRTDVSVEADVATAIATAVDGFGRLDVLYNNAASSAPPAGVGDHHLRRVRPDDGRAPQSRVLRDRPRLTDHEAAAQQMIISTSSVCGLTPGIGTHLYTVAKAAVIMLTKTAALELADWDVRVNAVCPGYVATPLTAGGTITQLGRDTTEEHGQGPQRMAMSQPIGRMGEADRHRRARHVPRIRRLVVDHRHRPGDRRRPHARQAVARAAAQRSWPSAFG